MAQNAMTVTGLDPFSHYLVWISAFNSIEDGPTSVCPSIGHTSEGSEYRRFTYRIFWMTLQKSNKYIMCSRILLRISRPTHIHV